MPFIYIFILWWYKSACPGRDSQSPILKLRNRITSLVISYTSCCLLTQARSKDLSIICCKVTHYVIGRHCSVTHVSHLYNNVPSLRHTIWEVYMAPWKLLFPKLEEIWTSHSLCDWQDFHSGMLTERGSAMESLRVQPGSGQPGSKSQA